MITCNRIALQSLQQFRSSAQVNPQQQIPSNFIKFVYIFSWGDIEQKKKKHTLYPPSGIPTETHLQFHGLLCTAGLPCDWRCSSRMGCDIITGGRLCREGGLDTHCHGNARGGECSIVCWFADLPAENNEIEWMCSNSSVCEHNLKNSVWEFINLNWQQTITTAVDPMHASFTAEGNKQRLAGITGALVLGPLGI